MPVNGLVTNWEELHLAVTSAGSGSHTGIGTGQYGHQIDADTYWTPDAVQMLRGIRLQVSGASTGDAYSVTYTGIGAPTGITWTGSGWASVSADVYITNLKIYSIGGTWRLTGTLSVYVNGVKKTDIGSSGDVALDEFSGGLGPSFIPLIGIPAGASAGVSASTISLPDPMPDEYDYCSECTGAHFVGWRFKEPGGSYIELPVTLAPGSAAAMAGGCTDPGVGTVGASDCYGASLETFAEDCHSRVSFDDGEITECITTCTCPDGSIEVYSQIQDPPVPWEVFKVESESTGRAASVRLVPDLERLIKRMNSDYAALLVRDPFPQTLANSAYSCNNNGVLSSGSTDTPVHAAWTAFLELVTNSVATIEGPLLDNGYSPWGATGAWSKSVVYEYTGGTPVLCEESQCPAPLPGQPDAECVQEEVGQWDVIPDESYTASRSYSFPSDVGLTMSTYVGHAHALARYINSWGNPHWSYGLFTYPWNLDGAPTTWNEYFELAGSQHLTHPALSGETPLTGIRNHIISDPLATGALNLFLDMYFGGQRWPGISRWQTRKATPLTEYLYTSASSSLWSVDVGSLGHGAEITITPAVSEAAYELDLNLGSFTVAPFMYPHLCDEIEIAWTDPNIDSVTAKLIGVDGSEVTLGTTAAAHARPAGSATKYAGSWDQDYGAGVTTDQGSDLEPEGISTATMTDPERAFAFQLLPGYGAATLRFEIVPVDPSLPVEIDYPTLRYTKSADRVLLPESAHQAAIIHPSGPGVRYGNWVNAVSGTIQTPPLLGTGSYRPTIIDALCFLRLALLGVSQSGGSPDLTTELTSLFDAYEERSVGAVDSNSNGFILPSSGVDWLFALVNSMSEVPPLGCFPRGERSVTDWSEDAATFVQHAWSWCQATAWHINAGGLPELYDSSGATLWTADAALGVTGWDVSSHQHAVDNSESGFLLKVGGVTYAVVRPWRGTFSVIEIELLEGAWPSIDIHASGRHVRSFIDGGTVWVGISDRGVPGTWTDQDTGISADRAAVRWEPQASSMRVWLFYEEAGAVSITYSDDEGSTWSMATSIGTGRFPAFAIGRTGIRYCYWINGASAPFKAQGKFLDRASTVIEATFDLADKPDIDESGLAVAIDHMTGGQQRIEMLHVDGGSVIHTVSTDGKTFT